MSGSGLERGEHKELAIGLRRAEKRVEIDNDISHHRCGASRMKDTEAGIIVHDQGVLREGFTTVRAPFRETLNAGFSELFIGKDEHMFLSSIRTSVGAKMLHCLECR
jgi:hypothetical protein